MAAIVGIINRRGYSSLCIVETNLITVSLCCIRYYFALAIIYFILHSVIFVYCFILRIYFALTDGFMHTLKGTTAY